MPKTKQQAAQEKRLQQNIKQSKQLRAGVKAERRGAAPNRKPSSKKGGFFARFFGEAPQSVQQSIPYQEMYRDGICRVDDKKYTKTVQFYDINFQLAQTEDQEMIFGNYCDFLNYFDSSINVQLTLINQRANIKDFNKSVSIELEGDENDGMRIEYGGMIKGQIQKGNNGIVKHKYITFGIEAENLRSAKLRLERIETDILANFKKFGVQARLWTAKSVWRCCTVNSTPAVRKSSNSIGRIL